MCRTQTENYPIRPLETAEGLKQLLDWQGLIKKKKKQKNPLGSLEMDGNSLFPTQLDKEVTKCVCALICCTQRCGRPDSGFQSHIWGFVAVLAVF